MIKTKIKQTKKTTYYFLHPAFPFHISFPMEHTAIRLDNSREEEEANTVEITHVRIEILI